ncbi:MAG: hypothetical protein R2764_22115 [Bacteroidales bacterium]
MIVPDFVHLKSWCSIKGIEHTSNVEMLKHDEVKKRYRREVDEINKEFGTYEQVKKYKLMDTEWTIQTRELTANLKLRRKYICEKYKNVIEGLLNKLPLLLIRG